MPALLIAKSLTHLAHPMRGEPSAAQAEAGNYAKRKLSWQGLEISVENEAGSERCGVDPGGKPWRTRIHYPYGYIKGSVGADGEHVDCYLGPDLEDPIVYVVHQRRYGDWAAYDEDKVMIGFGSLEEATAAYLANYNDDRFLGPVTAMPVDEFVAKVRATAKEPAMIKSIVLFAKAHIPTHTRKVGPKMVVVRAHETKAPAAQADLFAGNVGSHEHSPMDVPRLGHTALPGGERIGFYATMQRDGAAQDPVKNTAWLAGPFATHDEAKAHVHRAHEEAARIDGRHHFNSFGTSSITRSTDAKFSPGRLNGRLGLPETYDSPAA